MEVQRRRAEGNHPAVLEVFTVFELVARTAQRKGLPTMPSFRVEFGDDIRPPRCQEKDHEKALLYAHHTPNFGLFDEGSAKHFSVEFCKIRGNRS